MNRRIEYVNSNPDLNDKTSWNAFYENGVLPRLKLKGYSSRSVAAVERHFNHTRDAQKIVREKAGRNWSTTECEKLVAAKKNAGLADGLVPWEKV